MNEENLIETNISNPFYTADLIKVDARLDLYIYGEIKDIDNPETIKLINMIEMTDAPIVVTISSYGGSMYSSFAIYNALKSKQSTSSITTIANGIVSSGAALIYMAGNERWSYDYTTFMVHGAQVESYVSGSMRNLEADMTFTNMMYKRFVMEAFKDKFTDEEISDICDKSLNKYLDTKEAMERGIVTHLIVSDDVSEEESGQIPHG